MSGQGLEDRAGFAGVVAEQAGRELHLSALVVESCSEAVSGSWKAH